jgi:hypothetical protein
MQEAATKRFDAEFSRVAGHLNNEVKSSLQGVEPLLRSMKLNVDN